MLFSTEQALRHFDNMMKALGIYEKVNNSNLDLKRWTKGEIKGDALMEARIDLIALCDKSFLKHTREEWADIFDKNNVWYERVQSYEEVIDDKQANAIGAFFDPGLGLAISTLLFGIGPAPELAVISDSNSTKFTPLCTTTVYSFSMLDYS